MSISLRLSSFFSFFFFFFFPFFFLFFFSDLKRIKNSGSNYVVKTRIEYIIESPWCSNQGQAEMATEHKQKVAFSLPAFTFEDLRVLFSLILSVTGGNRSSTADMYVHRSRQKWWCLWVLLVSSIFQNCMVCTGAKHIRSLVASMLTDQTVVLCSNKNVWNSGPDEYPQHIDSQPYHLSIRNRVVYDFTYREWVVDDSQRDELV